MSASTDRAVPDESGRRPVLRVVPPARSADVTDLEEVRAVRLTAAQQRRAAARARDLTVLLHERPDLAGVHAPADFTVDSVRWCV
jgi:hypothetical protein